MGWKGLVRDAIMLVVGFSLLFGTMDTSTAAMVLIAAGVFFTVFAWFRLLKM